MKKNVVLLLAIMFTGSLFAQAVKDRQVIPVAVTLNQVLRMTITNGGNIEFVFNSIDDYRDGLSSEAVTSGSANPATSDVFYQTDFTVASSTRWKLTYGSEEATFIGTDDPGETLALDNVGFDLVSNGTHDFNLTAVKAATANAELYSLPTVGGTVIADLDVYPIDLIEDNTVATDANAGDATENDFTIMWRCGTTEGDMSTTALLDLPTSPTPDRYVTNVLFELASE